jgi:hypothetical protein
MHSKKRSRKERHAAAFSPVHRDVIESYLTYLQRVLRLQDWTVDVDWSTPAKDAYATITPLGDSKHATVRFSEKFMEASVALRQQTLVHEMLHCHVFALEELGSSTVAALASKQAVAVFAVAHTSAVECLVDGLADAFAGLVEPLHLP